MLAVAHRTTGDPEAAGRLWRAGARVFEVDVRVATGSVPLVTHFEPTGPTWAGVYRDGWRLRRPRHVSRLGPPLRDVVAALPAEAVVLLDLKGDVPGRPAVLDRLVEDVGDPDRARLCGATGSLEPHAAAAGVAVWRTVGDRGDLGRALDGRAGPAPAAWSVDHHLLDPVVAAQLTRRAPVVAWTVNSSRRLRALAAAGVAGVTTDRAAVAAEAATS